MTEMVHEALVYIAWIFFWSTLTVVTVGGLISGMVGLMQRRKQQEAERPLPGWIRRLY